MSSEETDYRKRAAAIYEAQAQREREQITTPGATVTEYTPPPKRSIRELASEAKFKFKKGLRKGGRVAVRGAARGGKTLFRGGEYLAKPETRRKVKRAKREIGRQFREAPAEMGFGGMGGGVGGYGFEDVIGDMGDLGGAGSFGLGVPSAAPRRRRLRRKPHMAKRRLRHKPRTYIKKGGRYVPLMAKRRLKKHRKRRLRRKPRYSGFGPSFEDMMGW